MTEKRFTISIDSNDLKSLWDDERTEEEPLLWLTRSDRIGGIDDVCKLLNELHDKNEQLKLDLKVANDGADLYKDINEALEKENEQLKHDATVLIQSNKDYRKENEQLKSENQELKQYLSWQDMELEEMEDLND